MLTLSLIFKSTSLKASAYIPILEFPAAKSNPKTPFNMVGIIVQAIMQDPSQEGFPCNFSRNIGNDFLKDAF